jgi:DNA ligase-1
MPDLNDGESIEMQGSGSRHYVLKNIGGVYSCSCPAWRNQSTGIERRTCKHLRKLRGDAAEEARIGGALPAGPKEATGESQAPPLLLAESWDCITDPTGFWLSEKLDGVRAYWDGRQFLSRLGNLYHAPDWFIAGLPDVPLDGELWLGRKKFQRAVSIARRQDKSDHWSELAFVVFDAPALDKDFETRMAFVAECVQSAKPPHARALEQQRCLGIDHLQAELAHVEGLGGEGLMMRRAGSRYEAGRSSTLLKVKSFKDAEARVLKHLEGSGRHKGRLGALLVEMADGTQFSVGTGFSDRERENPPSVGSLVTVRYQELTDGGVPRFPSFVGVRLDSVDSPKPVKGEMIMTEAASTAARRFEFSAGNSNKFWECSVNGSEVTVRFGRIGTQGQTKVKSFSDAAAAAKDAEKLIHEKIGKGYSEVK